MATWLRWPTVRRVRACVRTVRTRMRVRASVRVRALVGRFFEQQLLCENARKNLIDARSAQSAADAGAQLLMGNCCTGAYQTGHRVFDGMACGCVCVCLSECCLGAARFWRGVHQFRCAVTASGKMPAIREVPAANSGPHRNSCDD